MRGGSERDLATIRVADEIIITRDRGDRMPGLLPEVNTPSLLRSGLAVSPRTVI